MTKTDKIATAKRAQADALFREHVQSVAFHLTLSRSMIDQLAVLRDYDWSTREEGPIPNAMARMSRWVPGARALERRGLIFHDWWPGWPKGHAIYQLTTAGELVCALCVEAGLMAPKQKQRRVA